MSLRYLFIVLFAISSFNTKAQSFTGIGGQIPDNGNSVDFTITAFGLPTSIDTIAFGLEQVCIDIVHTWDSDLDISLIAPDGTMISLISGIGGGDDNFTSTCLRSDAVTSIVQGNAPYSGTYRPMGQMGMVNNGQNPNGVWTLHILDTYPFADAGALLSWAIYFGNNPATYLSLESSDLPLVIINTNGQSIIDDPMVTAWMKIIDNGPGIRNYVTDSANNYNGYIGIELRGQSSLSFPQKQYAVETRDSAGNNFNTSILGMPAENDWVLYGAYNDKSLMRNALAYTLARDMGRYASRSRYCEVLINGEYKGVYTFFEKIKRDNNRVDIAGLTTIDSTGVELTGGYICSIDWVDNAGWTSNYPPDPTNPTSNTVFYQYIYPKDNEILPQQEYYIQQYVDSFETALQASNFMDPVLGWRKYADEGSFIDYFLVNELSKNVDGYRLSAFFYKDKITNGGKINMGPLWDFNLAWHNADYCNNQNFGGWAFEFTDYCSWDFPFWWRRLDQDTTFQNNVRCRWNELRTTVFDTAYVFNYIDSIALLVDESQQRHYYIYPVLGTYLWPNPNPLAQTYAQEIQYLKSWIFLRMNFMDANLPGNCINTSLTEANANSGFHISPNPASDYLEIVWNDIESGELRLYDAAGRCVMKENIQNSSMAKLDITTLERGVYLVQWLSKNKVMSSEKLIKF